MVENLVTLPSVHSTSTYRARNIIHDGEVSAVRCPVFDEDLTYLFYGRAEYRVDPELGLTRDGQYKPAAFIFDTNSTASALSRILPTDSGGFERTGGAKSSHFYKDVALTDLALDPKISNARKVIRLFYRNNRRYLDYRPVAFPRLPKWAFEARSYHKMISDTDSKGYDERSSTIEMILGDNVPLFWLRHLVLPQEFYNSDLIRKAKSRFGFSASYYRSNPKQTPDQTFEALRLKVDSYVRRRS